MATKIVVFGTNNFLMQLRQIMIKVCSKNISLNIFIEIHAPDLLILFSCLYKRHHRTTYVLHIA